jgi:RNA polymerase sigma factor (TIGR02999 family)
LQSTALVHEAYLKLLGQDVNWEGRAHFFGIAAQAMRRILVDHARAKAAEKRGGAAVHVELDTQVAVPGTGESYELVALDDALDALAKLDERQSRVVEMRYFAGLTIEETAEALGLSTPTVKRDWVTARLFLARHIRSQGADRA